MQHLLMHLPTGEVRYAVVAIGGFLGMGAKTLIVPWPALEVTQDDSALVFTISQPWLQQAPAAVVGRMSPAAGPHPRFAGSSGWGPDTPYSHLYNTALEQTISGEVVQVDTAPPMPGMAPGLQLVVKTEAANPMRVQQTSGSAKNHLPAPIDMARHTFSPYILRGYPET